MPAGTVLRQKKKKKSVLKNIRQTERRTLINRAHRSSVRTAVKKLQGLIGAGKFDEARLLLPKTYTALDRAIQQRVLHENTANRYKSRLTLALNAAQAAASAKKAD
jgi:small subunit ribosomal protein S20